MGERLKPYYDRGFAESDLRPNRIAVQGLYLLCRALNIQRTVAFVGSGISIPHGRPTWSQVVEAAEVLLEGRDSKEARDTLNDLKAAQSTDPNAISDPDLLPLRAHTIRMALGDDAWQLNESIAAQTRDDSESIKAIIGHLHANGVVDCDLGTLPDGARLRIKRASFGFLQDCVAKSHAQLAHRLNEARFWDHPRCGAMNAEELSLLPFLGVLHIVAGGKPAVVEILVEDAVDDGIPSPPLRNDPIQYLYGRLQLRRFLTTNYDMELEAGLERHGFERRWPKTATDDDGATRESRHAAGWRARSSVLEKNTAADLIDFAVGSPAFAYDIFHLHGRAERPSDDLARPDQFGSDEPPKRANRETAPPPPAPPAPALVVTERDYQRTYLRGRPERFVMSEALRVAFAGNPVLFVGLGMQESDVLRPLRRFVSDPETRMNRSIFALLPAEESSARRTRNALQLFVRYGVHTIYYGGEAGGLPNLLSDAETAEAPLYKFITLKAELRGTCVALGEAASTTEWPDLKKSLRSGAAALVELRKDLGDDSISLHLDAAVRSILAVAALPAAKQGSVQPIAKLLIKGLDALDSRVRAWALCRALEGVAGWHELWWKEWLDPPRERSYAMRWETLTPGDSPAPSLGWTQCTGPDSGDVSSGRARSLPKRVVRFNVRIPAGAIDVDEDHEPTFAWFKRKAAAIEPDSRRHLWILATPSGGGKGNLFSLLRERALTIVHASSSRRQSYVWRYGAFANTAFSTEFRSVIDGTVSFLREVMNAEKVPEEASSALGLEGLDHELNRLRAYGGGWNGGRILLVFSGIHFLFHRDGSAKNRELGRALQRLLDDDTRELPIDIVLMGDRERLQRVFDLGDGRQSVVRARHGALSPQNKPAPALVQRLGFKGLVLPKGAWLSYRSKSIAAAIRTDQSTRDDLFHILMEAVRFVSEGRDSAGAEAINRAAERLSKVISAADPVSLEGRWQRRSLHSRYLASITFAAVLEREAEEAGAGVHRLMHILERSSGISTRRDEVIIERILTAYRHTPTESSLDELILKHLSVVSAPVETVVLERCPEIARFLSKAGVGGRGALKAALLRLNRRMLLFRLAGRSDVPDEAGQSLGPNDLGDFERFAVHALVQSYYFRRVGSSHLEFADSRMFTASIAVSMPRDLPTPSLPAFQFLNGLVNALIEYPGGAEARHGRGAAPYPSDRPEARARERAIEVCALRAALGLMRSAFSLAVVIRFSELGDDREHDDESYGYLEDYRLKLRWLAFRAGELGAEGEPATPASTSPRSSTRVEALYRDEQTWIYNECGVVSLLQGNLHDAVALLTQAQRLNELVEGPGFRGPNGCRIRLNRCIADIESAQLERAERDLTALSGMTLEEPGVAAIALGYLGLVHHLRGSMKAALEHYERALEQLRLLKESRAVCVIQRHRGDLLRTVGDTGNARKALQEAAAEAETARQRDQYHRIQISLCQVDMVDPPGGQDKRIPLPAIQARLDAARQYADQMEMYSLRVDELFVRADLFEREGETRISGDLAINALSMGVLHGMRLRVFRAMVKTGAITAKRGYRAQALRILGAAIAHADRVGYQLCAESAAEAIVRMPGTR